MMADNFDRAIEVLLHDEGEGFVVNDHGRGACKWGVTLATAQEFHPDWTAVNIARLTREDAAQFYRKAFWERYGFHRITDPALASKVFNFGVNCGGGMAVRLLRRAVDSLDTLGNGTVGPDLAARVNTSDPVKTLAAFKEAAMNYHRRVAAQHPELAKNLPGWLARDAA